MSQKTTHLHERQPVRRGRFYWRRTVEADARYGPFVTYHLRGVKGGQLYGSDVAVPAFIISDRREIALEVRRARCFFRMNLRALP